MKDGGPESSEGGEDEMMDGPGMFPGDAIFNIDPDTLNMTAGEKYSLIFSYLDDDG